MMQRGTSHKEVAPHMSTHARAMKREKSRLVLSRGIAICLLAWCAIAPGRVEVQAAVRSEFGAKRQVATAKGVRLEGEAYVNTPQLQARADVIALDFGEKQRIEQVRALGRVNFKMDLPPKNGGAPAHVEATCNNATLDPATRTLVLTGKVDGFYQLRGGGKNSLSSERATLVYPADKQLRVDLEGGTSDVRIVVPPETLGKDAPIGTLVVTSRNARLNGSGGAATFTGNAHAVSTGGANAFDLTATEFIISRNANDTIDTLKTSGRTLLKIDLPPDQTPVPKTAANVTTGEASNSISRPTHMEVSADALTMNRTANTMVFDGNVTGYYRLRPAGAPAADYTFDGDRAVVRYAPQPVDASSPTPADATKLSRFQLEMTGKPGKPSSIQFPGGLDLGF